MDRPVAQRVGIGCLVGLMALGAGNARAQQGSLKGVVTDSAGAPIRDADVGIVALRRLTRTDEQGRFSFTKLPEGAIEVSVRRLSYQPKVATTSIIAAAPDSMRVILLAHPAMLKAINVSASEMRRREMIEDFYRRRTRGMGTFITREEIEKRASGAPSDMLRNTAGLRFVRVASGRGVRFPSTSINRRDCPPMIFIDGQKAPGIEVDDITLTDIEGIELYSGPSTTPLQFSGSSSTCGTIAIWSRPPPSSFSRSNP